jgi:hypothetical protein
MAKKSMVDGKSKFTSRGLGWLALLFIVAAALAIVVVPVWIVQPFKPETQKGLSIRTNEIINAATVKTGDTPRSTC